MDNTKDFTYKPKIVSIFSGCGGLDFGFHMEGYETVWANDFAEWACKSFAVNFGNIHKFGDSFLVCLCMITEGIAEVCTNLTTDRAASQCGFQKKGREP